MSNYDVSDYNRIDPQFTARVEAVRADVFERFGGTGWHQLSRPNNQSCVFKLNGQPDNPQLPVIVKTLRRNWYLPDENASTLKSSLLYEASKVAGLASAPEPPPVKVPELRWVNEDLPYTVYNYIPGQTLALQELRNRLNPQEILMIGAKLGEIMFWCTTLPSSTDAESFPKTPVIEIQRASFSTGIDLFRKNFHQKKFPELHISLRDLTEERGDIDWVADLLNAPLSVNGHGDLHPSNWLLSGMDGGRHLFAVLDWGNLGPTTPVHEADPLMRIRNRLGRIALGSYFWQKSRHGTAEEFIEHHDSAMRFLSNEIYMAQEAASIWAICQSLRTCMWSLLYGVSITDDQLAALQSLKLNGVYSELAHFRRMK